MDISWPDSFEFVGKDRPEGETVSCAAVLSRARHVSDLLRKHGVGAGDRVALWLSEGENQLAAIFGAWHAGATFCVLPSFAGRSNTERSQMRVDDVFSVLEPKLLLKAAGAELPDILSGAVKTVDLPPLDADLGGTAPLQNPLQDRRPDDMAFVQFTSGSTGGAKGAVVRFGQLKANLDAIAARTALTASDRMVSWAPL